MIPSIAYPRRIKATRPKARDILKFGYACSGAIYVFNRLRRYSKCPAYQHAALWK